QMAPRLNFESALNFEPSPQSELSPDIQDAEKAEATSQSSDEDYDIYAKEDFRDESSVESDESLETLEQMASDDDILNAEKELQDNSIDLEPTEGEGQV
ncbi:MAG TPA: hypothetical protein PLJ21_12090, partial [Pseudobdellovibrionaceae bacterium]|nr:hypothetical protein [Pseudobdellovibrionaceae bacterium]